MFLTVIYKYNITAVNLSPQRGELMQNNIQYYNTITIINQAFFRVGDLTKEQDERGFVQRSANSRSHTDHTLAVIANYKAFSIASRAFSRRYGHVNACFVPDCHTS